jgi:hypothetical protein
MPTYDGSARFARDFKKLTAEHRDQFKRLVASDFVPGLKAGVFSPRLRVKRVQSTAAVWEMTWAPDGRATFEYGDERIPGEPHVIWRRIGTHSVLKDA